jgi:hypothetical protein
VAPSTADEAASQASAEPEAAEDAADSNDAHTLADEPALKRARTEGESSQSLREMPEQLVQVATPPAPAPQRSPAAATPTAVEAA